MAKKTYKVSNGTSAEDRALDKMSEVIIKAIETISADYHQPWFSGVGILAQNIDGRKYNGANQFFLLLICQDKKYAAPIFGTFDRLTSKMNFGSEGEILFDKEGNELPPVKILKDEHSYPVFVTTTSIVHIETREKITWSMYEKLTDEEKKNYKVYRNQSVHNVFNIDQTNLKEARPELYKELVAKNKNPYEGRKRFKWDKVDDMIASDGWICPIHLKEQGAAFFRPSPNDITLPTFEQFETGEDFYATCIHEMAHSTGVEKHLNREGITNYTMFGSAKYGKEELIAEMTSALICRANGINNGVQENSVAYIQGWLRNIKQDPTFLKSVLNDVKKAFKLINDYIENVK